MTVSLKYQEILEENLVIDLEWLKEEFDILFDSKIGEPTDMDKKIANDILDYFIENSHVGGNIKILDQVLEQINRRYSKLLD